MTATLTPNNTEVTTTDPAGAVETYRAGRLVNALAACRDAIESVPKTGFNSFDNYHYHTEDDLLRAVRGVLAGSGIAMMTSIDGAPTIHTVKKEDGKVEIHCWAVWIFEFSNGVESWAVRHLGYGVDRGDKCAGKALTDAFKKALSRSFLIPSGDDIEASSSDGVSTADPRPVAAARAAAPAGRPAGGGGGLIWPFGDDKGKPLSEVSTNSLEWGLENRFDPHDERWGAKNREMRGAIDAELASRMGHSTAPVQHGGESGGYPGDDIPF